jgi:hypothetical protein
MRILLVDSSQHYPSNPLLAEALEEIAAERGWTCEIVDEGNWLAPLERSLARKVVFRLLRGRPATFWALNAATLRAARRLRPELLLVVKGAYLHPRTLERIKRETRACLVNYATDDPLNPRASTRWLVASIPRYDLYACTKRSIMEDVRAAGCPAVAYVPFAYKPGVHFPELAATAGDRSRFASDVVFVGGCDGDRVAYLEELTARCPDLRIRVYGGYWDREARLRQCHGGLVLGREYRLATGGARIALNLVRRANRDGHTMRTFEIPACGGFMLAERTKEHEELFADEREVGYFMSPGELVEKVRYYLGRDGQRSRMIAAAHERVTTGGHTYRHRLLEICRTVGLVA